MAQQYKLKQTTKQRISPVLRICGELLAVPIADIDSRIEKEQLENPYLEQQVEEEEAPVEFETTDQSGIRSDKGEFIDYWFQDDGEQIYRVSNQREESERQDLRTNSISMTEDLLQQLRLSNITPEQYEIGEQIIGSLDDRGYFTRSPQAIADSVYFETGRDVTTEQVKWVIRLIRTFEPAGIGAKDTQDCILLQLERMPEVDTVRLARRIAEDYWDLFFKREYSLMERRLGEEKEEFEKALLLIRKLNPFPRYGQEAFMEGAEIEPDFIILQRDGEIKFSLNRPNLRHLCVSQEGQQMLQQLEAAPQRDEQTINFLKDKLERAKIFIEAFNQREQTLKLIMGAIAEYQKEYFLSGDKQKLKPMKYEDITNLTGFTASTLSRVANDKYIQTNFGILKLKDLFSSSVINDKGEAVSSEAIRSMIAEIIASEDKTHPYTDQKLAEILSERGCSISRRTVTKYRERLDIPIVGLRKLK